MFLIEKIKKSFLPFYRLSKTKKILSILNQEKQRQAMFVGGCVRKYILNEKIDDIDIATTLTPDAIIKKFQNSDIEVKKTGIDHGTLTLIFENQKFEITTLRQDTFTDGRHANVEFTEDWIEDSKRRDFTINSIYLDFKGKIFDPQSGLEDLKNGRVKFIGDPNKRIKEDYLRILRFLRFSIQYKSFDIDHQTQKFIKLNLPGIAKLSKERIYSELEKIIKLENFHDIFKSDFLFEIFKLIYPELLYVERIKQLKKLIGTKNFIPIKELVLPLMLLDNNNNHQYFIHKYNVSNETKRILSLYADLLNQVKSNKNFFAEELKKNIFLYKKENIKKIFILNNLIQKKTLGQKAQEVFSKINNVSIPKFPVNGNDLIKYGVKSGKKFGKILKLIEKKWIENNFDIKTEEIKELIKRNI